MKGYALIIGLLLLPLGCTPTDVAAEPKAATTLVVTSNSFPSDGPIPQEFTEYGDNMSPALRWSPGPKGTQSYALLLEDPDAPGSAPFVHWLVFSIPPNVTSIPVGTLPQGVLRGTNSVGTQAYYGPKPPSGTHHYHFKVFALDTVLALTKDADRDTVVRAMQGHTLAFGEVIGTYSH